MKKKLFLGAALALALGAGAVTAAHFSGNGLFGGLAKDNVESIAGCELMNPDGEGVGMCYGETGICSASQSSMVCTGKRAVF